MFENKYRPEGSLWGTEENTAALSSWETMEEAMREGRILEGLAVRASGSLSLTVELARWDGEPIFGTIEREECVLRTGTEPIKDIAVITRVGKPVCFKILSIERPKVGAPIIRLSRAGAQEECRDRFLQARRPGDIIEARVTHLEHFGAFVDIGCGIVSLLSIDCLSVSRIHHPKDRLSVGESLQVVIKTVESDEGGHVSRIWVSRRELLGTWEENAALFSVGTTVTGIIRSVESYGIFVELTPNLAGLAEYREGVSVGQSAAVYIKNIIPERMKIKLVIIDTCRPPIPPARFAPVSAPDHLGHISRWRYSPESCPRIIGEDFDAEKF